MGCMCADGTAPASHVDACKLCAAVAIAPSAVVAIAPLALLPLLLLLLSLMPLLLVWSPTSKSANHSLEVVCVDREHAFMCVGCHSQLIYLTMHSKHASVFLGRQAVLHLSTTICMVHVRNPLTTPSMNPQRGDLR